MNNFRTTTLLFFVLLTLGILLPMQAHAQSSCTRLVLDDFANSTNNNLLVNEATPLLQVTDDGSPGTLGGFRNITLGPFQTSIPGSNLRTRSLIGAVTETYSLSSDVGSEAPVSIEYSADSAGLGLDLSGRDALTFDLFSNDVPLNATVTLVDGGANSASFTQSLPLFVPADPLLSQEIEFLFQSFTNVQNVDLSDIFSVTLRFEPLDEASDLGVDNFGFQCDPLAPEVTVTKTLTGESITQNGIAEPGETLTYTISFQNTGGSAITYMAGEIVETVPNNTTATGGDFSCTPDTSAGSSCTTPDLTIAAGTTETLTFIVQVDDPIPAGVTSIDNAIVVPDECPVAGNPQGVGNDCDESTPTPPPTPSDINVIKTLTGESITQNGIAEPGETLTYTITFTNTGGSAITYAAGEIVETVPNNTTATGGSFTCSPDNSAGSSCGTTNVFSVAAGATETLTFIVEVDDPIPAGVTSIDNAIVVPDECPVAGNPQGAGNDCDESTPTPSDINVIKALTGESITQNGIAEPGETLTYTISFQNTGGSPITYAAGEIVETVPNNTTATGGDFTCSPDNSAGSSCGTTNVFSVAAGATETLTFIVRVDDPIPAGVISIDNVIVVPGACPGGDCDVSTPTPNNITVIKSLTGESGTEAGIAEPGETLTYTISFQNTGGSPITYASGEIVETVPNNTTATGGGDFSCTPDNSAGNSCTTDALTIAAGATETLTFIVQVDDPIPFGVTSIDNVIVVPGACPGGDCDVSTPMPPPTPPELVPVLSPAGYLLLALGLLLLSGLAFRQRQIKPLT